LFFTNEQGYASYQRILGVDFVDDGVINSIQDMFTERTLVFLAEDFTELMPLTLSVQRSALSVARIRSATRSLSPRESNFTLARLPPIVALNRISCWLSLSWQDGDGSPPVRGGVLGAVAFKRKPHRQRRTWMAVESG